MRELVLYYGRRLAERTESNFDDVLIPVLDVLAPVIIISTGAILMLRLLGADISTVVMTAGGAALIVGLALRDTLGNILGGLTLLIDTPFRFGDLVLWEGVVCQIKRIGLRVTTLYNTEDHSDISVPNTTLAGVKLVNLDRPSPDLRVSLEFTITNASQVASAKTLLYRVAELNPYVLGDPARKLAAARGQLPQYAPDAPQARLLRWSMTELRRERQVDRRLVQIDDHLNKLLAIIRVAEKGGLNDAELEIICKHLDDVEMLGRELGEMTHRWALLRIRDPHLAAYPQDAQRLMGDEARRMEAFQEHLNHVRRECRDPDLHEMQRLDDMVLEFLAWLPRVFKEVTPPWKYPFVALMNGNANGGATLRLYVYVDDIQLEGFMRRQRVATELRELALTGLRDLNSAP
jgi:MscS family membrane protein